MNLGRFRRNAGSSNGTPSPDDLSNTVSTNIFDISSSEYARKRKELMKLAKALRAMG